MDLDEHESWAIEECLFMTDLLNKEGHRAILESCMLLGRVRLAELAEQYHPHIEEFFHTPRDQRLPLLDRYKSLSERHAFLIAADHTTRCAAAFLGAICTKNIVASASKSMVLTQSAAAARVVAQTLPPLNPIDEDPPFGEDLDWIGRDE